MTSQVRCRRIEEADTDTVVTLLTRGFAARRQRPFWQGVMAHLARRPVPPDAPRFGLMLESEGAAVGAILQIFSTLPAGAAGERGAMRCNVSSWYVEPPYRSLAPFLVSQALKQKGVTYLNVTSAPHTRKIVEAQGYVRYGNGVFVALPCLSRTRARARIVAADAAPQAPFEAYEHEVLKDHADSGCISLWCETSERAYPFVFRERRVKGLLDCAQLIYCPAIADFVRFAAPLGRYLAWRGHPLVILDSNGPVRGLIGKYFDDIMPRYFKGPVRPRLGDLAYTETAFFGV